MIYLLLTFRFNEEGFKQARAKPYKQNPSLKIAIEGQRYLFPEKKEAYVRFSDARPSRSARPDGRASPAMPNPLFGHAPSHPEYDRPPPAADMSSNREPEIRGRQSPTYVPQEFGYGRADSGFHKEPIMYYPEMNHRRRESLSHDQRFKQGTTTGNAFKQPEPDAFRRKVSILMLYILISDTVNLVLHHTFKLDQHGAF